MVPYFIIAWLQGSGTLFTPEAIPVIELPIGHVPLDQVDMFATDEAGAAYCAVRIDFSNARPNGSIFNNSRAALLWCLGSGCGLRNMIGYFLSSRFFSRVRWGTFHSSHASNGRASMEVIIVLRHVGQDAESVRDLQFDHILRIQESWNPKLFLSNTESQVIVLIDILLAKGVEIYEVRPMFM